MERSWIEVPVPCCRTILCKNRFHLLIPSSKSLPHPWQPQACSLCLQVCSSFIDMFFLDSTDGRYHMKIVFLFLSTFLNMIIPRPSMLLQMALFLFFFFEWYSILCVYKHIHFIYSFIWRWTFRLFPCLGYCMFCCYEHWGTWIFSSYSFIPDICWRLELLDHMETVVSFLSNFHTDFHSGCSSFHSPNSVRGFPTSPHALQHLFIGMRWYLIAVSNALSLLMSNAERLFICLLAMCVSSFKPQISTVRVTSTDFV